MVLHLMGVKPPHFAYLAKTLLLQVHCQHGSHKRQQTHVVVATLTSSSTLASLSSVESEELLRIHCYPHLDLFDQPFENTLNFENLTML